MAKQEDIAFKVSARAARLIGRENVASSDGALIELVKNCYDAEASACAVFFDNRLSAHFEEIPVSIFEEILRQDIDRNAFVDAYELVEEKKSYVLKSRLVSKSKNKAVDDERQVLEETVKRQLASLASLWIIDNGEGMSRKTIIEQWMVIGTDNKQINPTSRDGKRVKAGAKGIGRFALDRLGEACTLYTKNAAKNRSGLIWSVEWKDFEGRGKLLNDVHAKLETSFAVHSLAEKACSPAAPNSVRDVLKKMKATGTAIHIRGLSDLWTNRSLKNLFRDLRSIVPPEGGASFSITLEASSCPGDLGLVEPTSAEHFDYKVTARFDENQMGSISLLRKEFDPEKLADSVFERPKLQSKRYERRFFAGTSIRSNTSLVNLLNLPPNSDKISALRNLGAFTFTFYFVKRDASKKDIGRFSWAAINSKQRRDWLDQWGGIKVYMDNFRVRPYGEIGSHNFDWLQLGQRKQESPAAVSRSGAWRVNPQNIAGSIQLTRAGNTSLKEKSSREGFINSNEWLLLGEVIKAVIRFFEDDRSFVSSEILEDYKGRNPKEVTKKAADAAAKRLDSGDTSKSTEDAIALRARVQDLEKEVEEEIDEQRLLRALASVGITISTLTHELYGLRDSMKSRVDLLRKVLRRQLPESQVAKLEKQLNPYWHLSKIEEDDEKMYHWLFFALDAVRMDKRKRKAIGMKSYFERLGKTWEIIFRERQIDFTVQFEEGFSPKVKAYTVDFDSIFNNLVTNSLDAFGRSGFSGDRKIKILINSNGNRAIIRYEDSGPGLLPSIENPGKILDCHFSTKRDDETFEETGTGLGMWILDTIVNDYPSGRVEVLRPKSGFALEMEFQTTARKGGE